MEKIESYFCCADPRKDTRAGYRVVLHARVALLPQRCRPARSADGVSKVNSWTDCVHGMIFTCFVDGT